MLGIREYNKKITSLKNTRKITSSMKMISSVKLHRYSKLRQTSAPYWEAAREVLERNGKFFLDSSNVICDGYSNPKKSLILVITSDRGYCGRFNSNTIRKAVELSETLKSEGRESTFSCIGSKGFAFFKRNNLPITKYYEGIPNPNFVATSKAADDLFNDFTSGAIHEVWIVSSRKVHLTEEPVAEKLLPFEKINKSQAHNQDILVEDDSDALLQTYGRMAMRAFIYKAHLESVVSEHNARMSAMDSATSNCDQMIQKYIKLRNRARQTAITTELSEIVSGKEAIDN